jgi:hypothetical protein
VLEAPQLHADLGLYSDQVSFLEDALNAACYPSAPSDSLSQGGVSWQRDANFGTAEIVPPRDLAQRLDVLPQTYLKERGVKEKFILATTRQRGLDRLKAALSDPTGSSWPDAHFLGALHPVLDWAADRALASLPRGEVFAVRGSVDKPTVLLLGTLTNKNGRVVATSWTTVAFPNPANPAFAPVTPWDSAREAVTELGLGQARANPGPVTGLAGLQTLIPSAVQNAQTQMADIFEANRQDAEARVRAWIERLDQWDGEANVLIQRREITDRRRTVKDQRELVEMMAPDRPLSRPLLVVVPANWGDRA